MSLDAIVMSQELTNTCQEAASNRIDQPLRNSHNERLCIEGKENKIKRRKIMQLTTRKTNIWDPVLELNELQNRLNNLLGRTSLRPNNGEEALALADWAPLVDITEDDKEFLIKAELPGLKRDEVKVTVEDGVLSISGERKTEKEEKNKKFHRVERSYGSFLRSFTLPDGADATKVNAEFSDGVLNVRLAKTPKAQPKSIEIK
jgi:HSP20 family protein